MMDYMLVLLLSSGMVMATSLLYYEVLRGTWLLLPRMQFHTHGRVIVIIMGIFIGHTVAVWFYAGLYWLLHRWGLFGGMVGAHTDGFFDMLYFSASTYSSLGYGDITAQGPLRILASIQVINGLVLIGWSVSFTYLAMEQFWNIQTLQRQQWREQRKKQRAQEESKVDVNQA